MGLMEHFGIAFAAEMPIEEDDCSDGGENSAVDADESE